jgi:hypothetical protein
MSNDKEPKRPAPSSGRTTGTDWSSLTEKEFLEKENALRDEIRGKANGDFSLWQ